MNATQIDKSKIILDLLVRCQLSTISKTNLSERSMLTYIFVTVNLFT